MVFCISTLLDKQTVVMGDSVIKIVIIVGINNNFQTFS